MKLLLLVIPLTIFSNIVFAQNRIKEDEVGKYIGKKVEVLGRVYFVRSVNKDCAVIKLGYSLNSAKLQVYLTFKNATTLAGLINREFGHFIGTVVLIKGEPILIVDKLNNASCYAPKNEWVDSAAYYHKKGQL
jgi:hypothetical protein